MKSKRILESIFIAFFLILTLSCGQQSTEWKGSIEEADGVIVVKNPLEPIFGEEAIGLIEDLSIGEAEGREEYMFSNVTSVAIDDLDNIFVLDSKEAHIKVFDSFGKYKHTYGKKGQAPDEFQRPSDLTITPQNEILVNDGRARLLKFFDLNGVPLRQLSHARYWAFRKPQVDSLGDILGGYGVIGDKGIITQHIAKFTAELDESFTISTVELAQNPDFNPYFAQQYWALTREGTIVWGFPIEYKIHVMNSQGILLKIIRKEYKSVPITEEEKSQWTEDSYGGEQNIPSDVNIVWDEHRHAYQHISIDSEERIYVQTYEMDEESGNFLYDVFDSEGKCIARVVFGSQPLAWKDNHLFTVEEDEDGYQHVKRYKVTWNY